ncbi:uncharacterized protein MONOS_13358 [Monocercomonoides exilis]|uniref:uncharacterized protein n=1 Tax=Monocercomonoides exilis TaxID=2049356 RepID=UPI00355AA5D7|nr:hypothetical protein MONOS_13358 [Monocercomonoides exilis]|eukprot:MONOS_13358.1-p1 / transcript=MONOS_13358.1 / gene=MONOS_13358 / organism=Monocercomonoides_exilis_PA203 / gene_product=unspecified product / transcript_product=unspecified product / location=Mono_scaffold00816:12024-12458(-) / protein_length=126 / sequence_SO=supercontig / SO=protein_coding / is_pseudo=false
MISIYYAICCLLAIVNCEQSLRRKCENLQLDATELRHQCGAKCQNELSTCFEDSYPQCSEMCSKESDEEKQDECMKGCISQKAFVCLDVHRFCNTGCNRQANQILLDGGCIRKRQRPQEQNKANN